MQTTNSASGISPALAGTIARQPGVRAVTEVRKTNATVAGAANRSVEGVDPAAIGQFTNLGVTAGQVSALDNSGTIMVSSAAAAGGGWKVGDTVQVQFGSYGVYRLRIAAIFANVGPLSDYLVSNATLAADSGVRTDSVDLVQAPASARGAIQAALTGYPGAQLLDQTGYIASQTAVLNSLLTLVTAMLVLAIVIALLGTVLGVGLGVALAEALTRSQHATVAIPAGQLLIYILATGAAGVLASIGPARRAAKLNMLTAIAAE